MQARNDPAQLASKVAAAALYGDHYPYGFTNLGTEASLKAITRDDMQAFWKENFVPNNAALVVAGDISMAELKPLAESAFGAWTKGAPVRKDLGTPKTTSARVIIVDKPGAPQTALRVEEIGAARSTPDFNAGRSDEHGAWRTVLEPHQHEPAQGSRIHPALRPSSCSGGRRARS